MYFLSFNIKIVSALLVSKNNFITLSYHLDINCSSTVIVVSYLNNDVVGGEEVGDGFAPFDNDDVVGICKVFGEIFGHEAWV